MKYFLLSIGFIISIFGCKKESTSLDTSSDGTPMAIPVPQEERITETKIIDSESFSGAAFKTKVPKGFTAKPSLGSGKNFNNYNSYFFISPDELVQFYAYSTPTKTKPNDIIFPNEKIEMQVSQSMDTIITTWKLPLNKQTGYIRAFTEKSFDNGILITGYYFKDEAAYDKYLAEFNNFKNSIKASSK